MRVLCYGEVLWDCLPSGRHIGGAPFNVAAHLARYGHEAIVLSAVGEDALGAELLERAHALQLKTDYIGRDKELPTGTVSVTLNENGQPSYTIHEPVAWDRIPLPDTLPQADALVYGSLACRSEANRASLERLLQTFQGFKVFDINLREPFDKLETVKALARHADLLKLNDEELERLSPETRGQPIDERLKPVMEALERKRICVTLGADGALYREGEKLFRGHCPKVNVVDTVGAGDAFLAALLHEVLGGEPADHQSRFLDRACEHGAWVAARAGAVPTA